MEKLDNQFAARHAAEKMIDYLIDRATRDTTEAIASNDIPTAVTHYAHLKDDVDAIAAKVAVLQKHLNMISHEYLPTMFQNQDVRSITVENVGRVTIADRWSASMLDKERAFEFLRSTGNGGIIIETVMPQTLGAFARTENEAGRPLPKEIFKSGPTPHVSITKV